MSIYSKIAFVLKNFLGIKDFSKFEKNIHKRIGKFLYKKKYYPRDVVNAMCSLGMKSGCLVCIHCAMKEFYNYVGTPEDLIDEILKVLGPDGTLMMPAYPNQDIASISGYVFDKDKDPTDAGALAEAFRKYPGVLRSISIQHSVCAIGRYADYLTRDHQNAHDPWGEESPYRRLCKMGGMVFNLGMPDSYIGTFYHCIESTLQYDYPYWAQFFSEKKINKYYACDGSIKEYQCYDSNIERRIRPHRITKYFTDEDWKKVKVSNLLIKVFYIDKCYPKMLNLGKKGISIYYIPNPRNYSFN